MAVSFLPLLLGSEVPHPPDNSEAFLCVLAILMDLLHYYALFFAFLPGCCLYHYFTCIMSSWRVHWLFDNISFMYSLARVLNHVKAKETGFGV